MGRLGIKTYLAAGALCLAGFGAYCAFQAEGPNRELAFVREVPTALPPETLTQSIQVISNWPQWFFTLAKAERVDVMGRPFPTSDQILVKGALVQLEIQPHKGEHRGSFQLEFQISDFVPNKFVSMKLVKDQSGRIAKLFDRLDWKIELLPGSIRATETAHTRHWRSRMMASLAQRTLMNQLLYPDVMALGQFTQPQSQNPYPVYGQ